MEKEYYEKKYKIEHESARHFKENSIGVLETRGRKKSIEIETERKKLYKEYKNFIQVNYDLDRQLVSFQANKKEPFYAWFKYKEGFSSKLVEYFLNKYKPNFVVMQARLGKF